MIQESGSMFDLRADGFSISISISISRHVTTRRTMGCLMSTPAFYHPDLLAVLRCEWFITSWKGDRTYKWYNSPLLERVTPTAPPMRPRDPDWVRNSHLGIELVDILNDALKAMGGWPRRNYCCGSNNMDLLTPPQMVEAFNKVCKKFNEAKLFNMGLQCRAGMYNIEQCGRYGGHALCVLVEKKSDEKLRDAGETLEYISILEKMASSKYVHDISRQTGEAALAWSPPADWMSYCYMRHEAFPTPYNETP